MNGATDRLEMETGGMAYREKLAWAGLISLVLCYGLYFIFRPLDDAASVIDLLRRLGGFAAATVGRGLLWGAAALYLMWKTPRADRAGPDERDRSISRRGSAYAYGVMIAGMIVVGIIMPFSDHGWAIVNAALFAIAVSEAVRLMVAIASYRRGWHG